jgi:hypothetical protein
VSALAYRGTPRAGTDPRPAALRSHALTTSRRRLWQPGSTASRPDAPVGEAPAGRVSPLPVREDTAVRRSSPPQPSGLPGMSPRCRPPALAFRSATRLGVAGRPARWPRPPPGMSPRCPDAESGLSSTGVRKWRILLSRYVRSYLYTMPALAAQPTAAPCSQRLAGPPDTTPARRAASWFAEGVPARAANTRCLRIPPRPGTSAPAARAVLGPDPGVGADRPHVRGSLRHLRRAA